MVARIAPDPIVVNPQLLASFRSRQTVGERPLVQDSAPAVPSSPDTGGRFPDQSRPQTPEPAAPSPQPGASFAAAVIAGSLSPTPQSIEEVYARIGSASIPAESESQLRGLIA